MQVVPDGSRLFFPLRRPQGTRSHLVEATPASRYVVPSAAGAPPVAPPCTAFRLDACLPDCGLRAVLRFQGYTDTVEHEDREITGVRNVTLSLPAGLLQEARHLAVDSGLSLSKYLALLLEERVESGHRYRSARGRQEHLLRAGLPLGTNGHPSWTRDELHER